jgi:hypothetical protein
MDAYVRYVADRTVRSWWLTDAWTDAFRIVRVDLWPGSAADYERCRVLAWIARLQAEPVMIRMWCWSMVLVCGGRVMVFWMIVIDVDVRMQRRDEPGREHEGRSSQDRYEATHEASVRDGEWTVQ